MNQISNAIKKKFASLYDKLQLKDAVIMVVGQNSTKTLVTCLAVMNSGAAYLPIDQNLNSPARIRQIYEEAHAKLVISSENTLDLQNLIGFEELWLTNSDQYSGSPGG
jgi:long-subunit acyl-CoA synthetase (AMP-forming)